MSRTITPRGDWLGLVSYRAAYLEQEDDVCSYQYREKDLAFLMIFRYRCQCLAFVNYSFVPLVYILGCIGQIRSGYGLIVLQVLGGTYQQVKLLLSLRNWCLNTLPHLQGAFDSKLRKPSLGCLPHTIAFLFFFGGLPEWICPVVDALCVGSSWRLWSSLAEQSFEDWCFVPLPKFISRHGLPMVLSLFLYGSQLTQMWEGATCYSWNLRRQSIMLSLKGVESLSVKAAGERCKIWQELASCTDVNGLVLLADGLRALGESEIEWLYSQQELDVIDDAVQNWEANSCCTCGIAGRKLVTKILIGVVPSLWLTIALLAMTFDWADQTIKFTCIVSICVGVTTVVKAAIELVCIRTDVSTDARSAILTGCTVCFVGLCVLRLSGVFFCESHHLNIWEFHCTPWNVTLGLPKFHGDSEERPYANYKSKDKFEEHGVPESALER